jgi:PEP-CTERM motif
MLRAHWLAILGAMAAFFTTAQADAGPIPWSYSTTITGETGQTRLAVGSRTLTTVDPQNGDPISTQDYFITAPLPSGFSNSVEGSGEQIVGGIGNQMGAEFFTTPPPGPIDQRFRVTLNITDLTSGESGSAEFLGTVGIATWWNEFPTPYEYDIGLSGQAVLNLGGNRYDITVAGGFTEDNGIMTASVMVAPAVPEPATIGLATLGLAGAWTARRLRRSKT